MSKIFIRGKVIVISGSPHETAIQTEIFDLWDQDYSFIGQNYSIAVDGSVGIFAQSMILNCGGAYPFISNCFLLDQNGFQSYASLLEPRGYAASIMVNGIFWITGGGNPGFSNSSEILDLSEAKSRPGPGLPKSLFKHCLVEYDANQVMLIGGYDGRNQVDDTFIYDFITEEWKSGPVLQKQRDSHACTVHRSRIWIIGGYNGLDMKSVEVLDQNGSWIDGPELPYGLFGHQIVSITDNPYVLGGFSFDNFGYPQEILKLQYHGSTCQWIKTESILQIPRNFFTALSIPDLITDDKINSN